MAVGRREYPGEPIFAQGNGFFGGHEIVEPGTPLEGEYFLYVDSTSHALILKQNGGSVTFGGALADPVPVANGGTGLASLTQGDLLFYTSGTALTALAKNTDAQRVLTNGGTDNAPAWDQVALGSGVDGILPLANGGTGLDSFTQGDIPFYTSGALLSKLAKSASVQRVITNGGTDNAPAWGQVDLTTGVTGVLPIANGGNGWTTAKVAGSDVTETGQTLVAITGLEIATVAATLYEFEALLYCVTSADVTGCQYGVSLGDLSPTNSVLAGALFTGPLTGVTAGSSHAVAFNTAETAVFMTTSAQTGVIWIRGFVYSGDGAGSLNIRHLKTVSGTSTVKIGSWLRMRAA